MNYLFKKALPRPFHTCTGSSACAAVGSRDFGSAKPMGYSSVSAKPTRVCCCWHHLVALSQGWKCGTTVACSSHPYIIFAHCQRHVCTLELLRHKVKYPMHPQHRHLLRLVQQFKSQYLTLPLQFFSHFCLLSAVSEPHRFHDDIQNYKIRYCGRRAQCELLPKSIENRILLIDLVQPVVWSMENKLIQIK